MSIEVITLLMFISLLLFLVLGLPIAFVMGGVAAVSTLLLWGSEGLSMAPIQIFGWMQDPILLAIPFFVFMALLLEGSGIANDLYEMMYIWLGFLRGGLAMGTVLICTVFAAISGLSATGAVTMGIIALPAMLKYNYDKSIAVGCIAAGGTLGILIPPSVMMIIFGLTAQVSAGKLFAAGIVPGLLISFLFIMYIGVRAALQPQLCPRSQEKFSWREKFNSIRALFLPLFLILAVLGSIFGGLATPTEAASLGAVGALVCTLIKRKFTWELLKQAMLRTLRLTSMILWIIFGSVCFITVYTAVGATQFVTDTIVGLAINRWLIVIAILFILFIMGMFLDPGGIILLAAPIFVPIIKSLGFDPLWFGVLFVVNLQMAYITPPFGFDLFYLKAVAPSSISMGDIYKSILPFVGLLILGTALIMIFPGIATWLPSMMIK